MARAKAPPAVRCPSRRRCSERSPSRPPRPPPPTPPLGRTVSSETSCGWLPFSSGKRTAPFSWRRSAVSVSVSVSGASCDAAAAAETATDPETAAGGAAAGARRVCGCPAASAANRRGPRGRGGALEQQQQLSAFPSSSVPGDFFIRSRRRSDYIKAAWLFPPTPFPLFLMGGSEKSMHMMVLYCVQR